MNGKDWTMSSYKLQYMAVFYRGEKCRKMIENIARGEEETQAYDCCADTSLKILRRSIDYP